MQTQKTIRRSFWLAARDLFGTFTQLFVVLVIVSGFMIWRESGHIPTGSIRDYLIVSTIVVLQSAVMGIILTGSEYLSGLFDRYLLKEKDGVEKRIFTQESRMYKIFNRTPLGYFMKVKGYRRVL